MYCDTKYNFRNMEIEAINYFVENTEITSSELLLPDFCVWIPYVNSVPF